MQFFMINNAEHSLKVGIDEYKKFVNLMDTIIYDSTGFFGYLKMTTLMVHNTVELMIKQILCDIDELLVFDVDSKNEAISRLLYKKYIGNNESANLDFWLANMSMPDLVAKTKNYNECVTLFFNIFSDELSKEQERILHDLAIKRNCLIHLGYWDDFGWHTFVTTINDSLLFILDFLLPKIKRHNIKKNFIIKIMELIEKAETECETTWFANCEAAFDIVYDFLNEINTDSISVELDYDESTFQLYEITFKSKELSINYSVLPNVRYGLLFLMQGTTLKAIIDIDKIDYNKEELILSNKKSGILLAKNEIEIECARKYKYSPDDFICCNSKEQLIRYLCYNE